MTEQPDKPQVGTAGGGASGPTDDLRLDSAETEAAIEAIELATGSRGEPSAGEQVERTATAGRGASRSRRRTPKTQPAAEPASEAPVSVEAAATTEDNPEGVRMGSGGDQVEIRGSGNETVRAGTVTVNQGGLQTADAEEIRVRLGGIGQAHAEDVAVTIGGIGLARAQRVSVEMGSVGAALAGQASLTQGFANLVVARDAELHQSFARAVVANHVTMRQPSGAFMILARSVDGDVRTLLDWRGAVAFGAAFGLVAGLVRGGRSRRAKRK